MSKKQTLQLKYFKQLSRHERSKSNAWHIQHGKVFHPYGSNQDSCMLDGSPSLSFGIVDDFLDELAESSSSADSDEYADNNGKAALDDRLSPPMSDESGENGLVDSESEDDDDAGAPAPSTGSNATSIENGSEGIGFEVRSIVGIYHSQNHINLEDDEATGGPAASKAARSRPLSGCKRMFADTRNDSDDSDSYDDPGLAKTRASLTI